jgi:transposase-like protein
MPQAAKRLFRQALGDPSHPQPRVINTDQAPLYGSAIPGVLHSSTVGGESLSATDTITYGRLPGWQVP